MTNNPNWTDNAMPMGSRVETIKRGVGAGTTVGLYIFDNITPDRPSKVIERTDEIGKPNGFAIVEGFVTASGVLQIATAATPVPKIGDWFSDTFDGSTAGVAEVYVISQISQPFEKEGYRKCNVQLRLSPTPPTA